MQATAQKPVPAAAVEPGIDPVYLTRDDLARAFPPANAYERMLLTNAALAQQRLLRAYELERRVLEKHDIVDLFTEKPEMFKAMARHIAECERILRRAIEALERAQRNRAKTERTQTSTGRLRPYVEEKQTGHPPPATVHLSTNAAAANWPQATGREPLTTNQTAPSAVSPKWVPTSRAVNSRE